MKYKKSYDQGELEKQRLIKESGREREREKKIVSVRKKEIGKEIRKKIQEKKE